MGTPFIELNQEISLYIEETGDECIREYFSRMAIHYENSSLISPYGISLRMINWAMTGDKTPEQMYREIKYAREILDAIDNSLIASKLANDRAREKIHISREKLSDARRGLIEAYETIDMFASPLSMG